MLTFLSIGGRFYHDAHSMPIALATCTPANYLQTRRNCRQLVVNSVHTADATHRLRRCVRGFTWNGKVVCCLCCITVRWHDKLSASSSVSLWRHCWVSWVEYLPSTTSECCCWFYCHDDDDDDDDVLYMPQCKAHIPLLQLTAWPVLRSFFHRTFM